MTTRVAGPRPLAPGILGMWLFIASEAMFFAGLFAAYFSVRAAHDSWPPADSPRPGLALALALTTMLLASSVTQHLAARDGGPRQRRLLAATITLGALFLTGQAFEWSQLQAEGLSVDSGAYGTLFFLITGAHGLHVLAGLAMLGGAAAGLGAPRAQDRVEAVTHYWHFVDVVWLLVLAALYVSS